MFFLNSRRNNKYIYMLHITGQYVMQTYCADKPFVSAYKTLQPSITVKTGLIISMINNI